MQTPRHALSVQIYPADKGNTYYSVLLQEIINACRAWQGRINCILIHLFVISVHQENILVYKALEALTFVYSVRQEPSLLCLALDPVNFACLVNIPGLGVPCVIIVQTAHIL